MKKQQFWNAVKSFLFGIGLLFLIIAIALSDPKPTLMCFALGLVCVFPGAMDIARENVGAKTRGKESFDDQRIRLLGNLTAVCGISFYVMLIVMKVLSGFDYRIPDWIAVIWFMLMVIALISAVLRDHFIKNQKEPKSVLPLSQLRFKKPASRS